MNFRLRIERWWLGANRAGLQGGAVAMKAYLGGASASVLGGQLGLAVPALTLEQGAWVFAFAFAWHFFDYLADNPMPEIPAEKQ